MAEKIELHFGNVEDFLFKVLMNRSGLSLLCAIFKDEPGTFEHRRAIAAKLEAYRNEAGVHPEKWKEALNVKK